MREIKHHLLGQRLLLALLLNLAVFGLGTVAAVKNQQAARSEYERYHQDYLGQLRQSAEKNLSGFATREQEYLLSPRRNAYLTEARENFLPNLFAFNGYGGFGFRTSRGRINPYLESFQDLSWLFIVSLVTSFTVLLLSFDSISGEKEDRTLSLVLANNISRGGLLFGKFLGVAITALLALAPGMALSLLLLLLSGIFQPGAAQALELGAFLLATLVLIAFFSALGLLASVLSSRANVSVLTALAAWVFCLIFVPHTAVFWSDILCPVESRNSVDQRIALAHDDINNNAPRGSWSSSSDNPFLPQHELRARNQTNLFNSRQGILNAYYENLFRQFERTRLLTCLSPVSLYEYLGEASTGGGYLRFREVWRGLHAWQTQFEAYFKEKDAGDKDSPHWYNPYEDYSTTRKGVSFEEVPVYSERPASAAERAAYAAPYLVLLIFYTGATFALSFVLFSRYDVR